jgi:hypothetical protein
VVVIIESAISEATAMPSVEFNESERQAIGRVLAGMLVEHGLLPDGLQCLREALMIESGDL